MPSHETIYWVCWHIRRLFVQALSVLGSLSWLAAPLAAQELRQQFRSLSDVRPRIPDEHDRPYFRETQSHRGWEIREPQFTVFAATSVQDAREAAGHVSQAWNDAAGIARRWTDVPSNPDFGLSALQVVIDNHPIRDRDAPETTVNVVGIRTQVQINVAPGQPALKQQLLRVREGAAFAALHATGLDAAVPPWVVAGIAAHAGRAGLTPEEVKQYSGPATSVHFGGQQWRFERSAEDSLDYRHLDHHAAAGQVAFLLTGDDAEHAPAFLNAIRDATATATRVAAEGAAFQRFPGNSQPSPSNTAFDQLLTSLAGRYAQWKEQPLAGQPVFEPEKNVAPELLATQREMLVLLKLQRRLTTSGTMSGRAETAVDRGALRTKVTTFDRAKGAAEVPANKVTPAASFAALAARLSDPGQPMWGTLDVDGSLLLSTDRPRVNELLGGFDQRYRLERENEHMVLVRRLEGERMIRGWLEENPKDKTRPLARFEVVELRKKAKAERAVDDKRQARRLPRD